MVPCISHDNQHFFVTSSTCLLETTPRKERGVAEPTYRNTGFIDQHFASLPMSERPYSYLARALIRHTEQDIVVGLDLIRDAVEHDRPLVYRKVKRRLNQFLDALAWLNGESDNELTIARCAAQLELTPRHIRHYIARAHSLPVDGPNYILETPPSFDAAVDLLIEIPVSPASARGRK